MAWAFLVMGLSVAGATDEAVAMLDGLRTATDATANPAVLGYALMARGLAYRYADAIASYDVYREGLAIARASGNRLIESHLAGVLAQVAAVHGEPADAFDYLTLAIDHFSDAGSFAHLGVPLAILATVFDRLGYHEPAATISAFAATSLTQTSVPEINTTISHLREVLGNEVYESLARTGETMTNAEMATYAVDQMDRARVDLVR
jgi:hypothetical protein